MTAWERVAVRSKRCGGCGELMLFGAPVKVYELDRGRSQKPLRLFRCATCDGPAPPDLPAVVERAIGVTGPRPALRPWAEIDAGRSREPGEEG